MVTINAKDYSKRSELENKVRNLVGLTADMKPDYLISGTRVELQRLQLSDKNIFWGIAVKITDTPTEAKPQVEKPQRGEKQTFGINGDLKK